MPHFHVLLLEDDPVDVELITTTLRNNQIDCSFSVVNSRETFITAMESQRIDLVLADYALPSFDGISAIALVQSYNADIPCILISGVLGEERAIEALKSGATDYVLKDRLDRLEPAFARAIRARQERLQLKETTAALKASEERFRTSVETMVDCFIILNARRSPDGNITDFIVSYLNAAACEYLAVSAKEQIGSALSAVIPGFAETIQSNLFYAFCFTIDSGRPFQEEIFLHPHLGSKASDQSNDPLFQSDQPFVALEMKASKLDDSVVVTWRDITAQKQVEKQRLQLLKTAEQARNQAETANHFKDEFIATLSHELRTPLNAIDGWVQLAQRGQEKPERVRQALDIIRRNTTLLARMIDNILDTSRIRQDKLKLEVAPIAIADFNHLIANTLETISPAAIAKNIEITFSPSDVPQPISDASDPDRDIASDLPSYIVGDRNRLQQVVLNLLSNAIKFTPEGGTVKAAAQKEDSTFIFSVEDNGIGIEPTFLSRIFNRFEQVNSVSNQASSGLGLGLSIVQHIVGAHGGKITAQSNGQSKGSRFQVSLPLRNCAEITQIQQSSTALTLSSTASTSDKPQAASAAPNHKENAATPPPLNNVRVLVVEDQPDALELYKMMLESHQAEVAIATSVAEALKTFSQFQPHVIVSDIELPDGTGYSLIRKIRASPIDEGNKTPAIALSAYTEAPYRTRALLAGFQLHLPKPIDLEQLVVNVYQLVKKGNAKAEKSIGVSFRS